MNNQGVFVLASALLSMFLAQFLKVVMHWRKNQTWNWRHMTDSGGMPSSHAALMTSLTMSMWLVFGWKSPWFSVAFVCAIVVMYDAVGVRRQAGEHALILQELMLQIQRSGVSLDPETFERFRHWKRQGHTPREVLGGIALGIIVSEVTYFIT